MDEIAKQADKRFNDALQHLENAARKIQTGRAQPSMLDDVKVEAYGQQIPLNQAANINAVEAQLLQITPFDPNNLQAIAEAIRNDQSLGLNPSDDGRVVRVPIPALTTERRQQIVKQLNEKVEDCQIALRNVRHDALKEAKKLEADKQITRDDVASIEKEVEQLMNNVRAKVEAIARDKEQEIMEV